MRGRERERESWPWHGRNMKEENERNEKAKVCALVDGAVVLSQCAFNDSIKTKIRAQEGIYVVKAVRNRTDFTSYRAVIVVRKAESFDLQEVGVIAAENRGLNETDRRPLRRLVFTCPSTRLTTMRLLERREFYANRDTYGRVNAPLN